MTFIHAAILWGSALAAAPIVIHLLMRSKPRLVVFPALRFVKLSHNANVTRHRLKHLLLLLMRMAAIVLLAVILARPKIQTAAALGLGGREPVSAVVIIDTSGSMAYRIAGRPRIEDAKRLACELLKGLPAGSHAAAIWPDRGGEKAPLSPDLQFTIRQIQGLTDRPAPGRAADQPAYRTGQRAAMVPLLRRAYRSLENAPTPRREIYVFSDRTRDSWTELAPRLFDRHDKTTVYLFDVGANDNQDFLVAAAQFDAQVVSPRRWPLLAVSVRPGELTGKRTVEVQMLGDEPAAGAGPQDNPPGSAETVARQELDLADKLSPGGAQFKLAPLAPGLHGGLVRLDGQDEIPEDNVRYLALEAGPLPQVVMVESQAGGRAGWSVADLVEAVLAVPMRVRDGTAPVDLVRVPPADFLIKPPFDDRGKLDGAHAVILADVGVLGAKQWDALRNYVGAGGTLIVLTGPGTDPAALSTPEAAAVLPVPGLGAKVQLAAGVPAAYPDFEKGASRVLATYRRHDRKPLIDRERVFQYYPLPAGKPLPPDTAVLLRLSDATAAPLLLERRLGTGHVLMLTTSPQADWTEWSQGASWVGLILAMTTPYTRGTQRAYQFVLDQPAGFTPPASFRGGSATITPPDGQPQESSTIDAGGGAVRLPTRHLGHYRVALRAPGGEQIELLYAVNFDPAEYALTKKDPEELTAGFPPGRFVVVSDPAELERSQARARASREEVGTLIGVLLLVLLIAESFFSNRFYRVPTAVVSPAAPVARVVRDEGTPPPPPPSPTPPPSPAKAGTESSDGAKVA